MWRNSKENTVMNVFLLRGQGIFPLSAIFTDFPLCKKWLRMYAGSAYCSSKISKWILSCMVSLSKINMGVAAHFNKKFCNLKGL